MVDALLISEPLDVSLLRQINDYVPGVIYQYQTDLTSHESSFTYLSPRSIDLFEHSAETLLNNDNVLWAMVHPTDLKPLVASAMRASRRNVSWCAEFRLLMPSGTTKWIQGQSDPDRSTLNYARHNGIFLDITDRKVAEIEVKNLADRQILLNQISNQIRNSFNLEDIIENALNASRAFFQSDSCSFAWYQTESDSASWDLIQTSAHEALPNRVGQYPRELVGAIEDLLFEKNVFKVDRPEHCQNLIHRKFLETIQCQSELVIPVVTQINRVGILINTYHFSQHDWTDREVEFLQAVAAQLAIAISHAELYQKSLDQSQQLQQTLLELQKSQTQVIHSEKMSSLGHLVAGIAHEINNPVNFIHGNLVHTGNYTKDLLGLVALYQDTYPTDTPAIAQYIEEIDLEFIQTDFPKILGSMEMGTDRIREIVKSLRNFSRLDESITKSVDIHQGIDSTLLILQSRIKGRGDGPPIVIEKNYGDLPLVECMAGHLNQVFMNIIVNAIDALDEQNLNRTLEQQQQCPSWIKLNTAMIDDRRISIVIQDNGPGIPDAIQSKIFDPFFTTKPVGKGTGMGMSISYQIITEKHNGQISVQSNSNGTTFILIIPIHPLVSKDVGDRVS